MVRLDATLVERDVVRYTPGGIAVLEMKLAHRSQPIEAGKPREIAFEMPAVVLGEMVARVAGIDLGTALRVEGFLAPARKGAKLLRLHVTDLITDPPSFNSQ